MKASLNEAKNIVDLLELRSNPCRYVYVVSAEFLIPLPFHICLYPALFWQLYTNIDVIWTTPTEVLGLLPVIVIFAVLGLYIVERQVQFVPFCPTYLYLQSLSLHLVLSQFITFMIHLFSKQILFSK